MGSKRRQNCAQNLVGLNGSVDLGQIRNNWGLLWNAGFSKRRNMKNAGLELHTFFNPMEWKNAGIAHTPCLVASQEKYRKFIIICSLVRDNNKREREAMPWNFQRNWKHEVRHHARIPPKNGGKEWFLKNISHTILCSKGLDRKYSYRNQIVQNSFKIPSFQRDPEIGFSSEVRLAGFVIHTERKWELNRFHF